MGTPTRQHTSPQARGRELARQGRQLWQELGSVRLAAAELMSRHRDIPSIQAFRYAAGLSQDQAAARYNEVSDHQTSVGGTTINAWETWVRVRHGGSPPPFSSLLTLAIAYGRGPLGIGSEDVSPGDLVAEAYERLTPEDQLSLKRFSERSGADGILPLYAHVPRREQSAYARTRGGLLESVSNTLSADVLSGLWVTSYEFKTERGTGTHADITQLIPQSARRITATNYPPEPRTQNYAPAFRNDIEAQLANRHLIGYWKNVSDTRYFGSIHLAVLPGENVMDGYYTVLLSDITVDAMPWRWIRIDLASTVGVRLSRLVLKESDEIHTLLMQQADNRPLALDAVTEKEA